MVCQWFHVKTTRMVSSSLASKPVVTVFSSLASKPGARVSRIGPQNRQLRFGDLGLKIITTVPCFGPQNQEGFSLSVAPQNRRMEDGAGHATRSGGLLHLEASCVIVSQFGLKTSGCATVGGARGTIMEVASRSS
jgi:hypothetical protein